MNMSHHARIRGQQRAIPPMLIDLLIQFGSSENAGDGASKLFFDTAARRRVNAYAGTLASALVAHLDLYVVVASDCRVITVGHRTERILRH